MELLAAVSHLLGRRTERLSSGRKSYCALAFVLTCQQIIEAKADNLVCTDKGS